MVLRDPLFTQVVLLGDKRPYLVALLVLQKEAVLAQAKELEIDFTKSYEEILNDESLHGWVDERLQKQTESLAQYEMIKYFACLPEEFTQARGELTPTFKIKRRIVMKKYASLIASLYEKGEGWSKAHEKTC